MVNYKKYFFILVCLVFSFSASIASASEWYVDNSVSSSGNGQSWATAWKNFSNIVWGAGGVVAGDTLYISGSTVSRTYNETLTVSESGSLGSTIKIKSGASSPSPNGHSGEVIIDGGGTRNNGIAASSIDYLDINGLTIQNTKQDGIFVQSATGIEVSDCEFYEIGTDDSSFGINADFGGGHNFHDNIFDDSLGTYEGGGIITGIGGSYTQSTVDSNTIDGLEGDGIVVGDNVIVSDNTVSNLLNVTTHSDGIVSQGSNVTIKQNIVSNCTQNIYIDSFDYGEGSESYCNNNVVFGNVVYATTEGQVVGVNGIVIHAESGGDSSIYNMKVYNNTVVDCNYNGIRVLNEWAGAIDTIDIENNLLVNNGDYSRQIYMVGNAVSNLTLDYNFYRNSIYESPEDPDDEIATWFDNSQKTLAQLKALSPVRETHGLAQQDPLFVNYSAHDYQLNSDSSPAKDVGKNLGLSYNVDREGVARPQGSAWDVGAYEYTSSETYTVTFDGNTNTGGSTASQSLVYNTPTNLTSNGFTKTGYSFAGWATTAGGSVAYADGASYTIGAGNVTLYAKWTAEGAVAAPIASPAGGVDIGTTVTLSSTTESASIYYTIDGSTPTTSSHLYSVPLLIIEDLTLKAIAVKDEMADSEVMSEVYTFTHSEQVATPVASPDGGTYDSAQFVDLSTTTDGADIYYTADGSTPTTSSNLYTASILVLENITIKAIAVKEGMTDSEVMSETYTINPTTATCTSFDYTSWGNCQSDGKQKREVKASYPEGCSGGSPDLKKSCTYEKRILKTSPKKAKWSEIITQSGKRFSKNSEVLLYFEKSIGVFYAPLSVKTNGDGKFSVTYKVNKAPGTYKWYALDEKTGKKSKKSSYKVIQ